MDLFKKNNNVEATSWDWNCPRFCKRCKGDSKLLRRIARRIARRRLKNELNKGVSNEGIVLEKTKN